MPRMVPPLLRHMLEQATWQVASSTNPLSVLYDFEDGALSPSSTDLDIRGLNTFRGQVPDAFSSAFPRVRSRPIIYNEQDDPFHITKSLHVNLQL